MSNAEGVDNPHEDIDRMEGAICQLHKFYRKIIDRNCKLEVENENLRDEIEKTYRELEKIIPWYKR